MLTIPMKWSDKDTNGSMDHCSCCGRKINKDALFVEVIDGGFLVISPNSNPDTSDPGYMGFFPVGKSCGKKYFKGFTQDITDWRNQ
jgi:hypothetical protein